MEALLARLRGSSVAVQVATIAGCVAVIAALLLGAYFAWFHSPYQVLYTDLRPTDAAAVVAQLDKKKVPYELRDGGATILVPGKVVDATRLSLAGDDQALKGGVGFEIFNKSDMGLTEFAQQINYRRALQGELERTITALDGIAAARVHLTIAEPSVFQDEHRPSKGSVTVIPRAGRVLPPQTITGIQRLVAAAVPDLAVADVVVLDEKGDVVSGEATSTEALSPMAQQKAAIEAYYAGRVREAFHALDPNGRVAVMVTARAAPGGPEDPYEAWEPAARKFPLLVSLALPADGPPSSALRDAAERALNLSSDAGDSVSISFIAAPPAGANGAPPPAASALPHRGGVLDRPSNLGFLLVLPLIALLAALVLLQRGIARRMRLSTGQQEAYASRLQALLEQRDADVAAP